MKGKLLPIIIVLFGIGNMMLLVATGPKLDPQSPKTIFPLVSVIEVVPERVQITSKTHGTVKPRTEGELIPEVDGRVMSVSAAMVSGGFFKEGDVLVEIDRLDYEMALEQAHAGLTRAESELGNAEKSYARQLDLSRKQLTSDSLKDDAMNRLSIAQASVREAKARLSKSQRDLSRTQLVAPYDGRVRTERVDIGQFVKRGNQVATIYATDFAEVRLPILDEELAFIPLSLVAESEGSSDTDSPVFVNLRATFAGENHVWQGQIVRTEGELDPRTGMVHVVARVAAPYNRTDGKPPLSVGLFVDAEIVGMSVDNIVVLPRAALRSNNNVFVVDSDNKLEFRTVEVLRETEDKIYVSHGLNAGERICVSPMDTPVQGMTVTTDGSSSQSVLEAVSS
ncbi:MAG: efflux RND transporter periplasmic adaptor subunit [Oceanicoccus sp.]